MINEFIKWLDNNHPTAFLVLFLIVGTVIITKFLMAWYNRFILTEKECKKIGNQLIPKIDAVQKSVNSVLIYLKSKDKNMDTSLFRSNSPLQLTPLGNKLLSDSGGKYFVDSHIEFLIKEINDQDDIKSPLDVENLSTTALLNSSAIDSFTPVKDFIYNNPFYKINGQETLQIDLHTIINIMSVYLRNYYLNRYPELLANTEFPV